MKKSKTIKILRRFSKYDLCAMIDHTLLKPNAPIEDVEKLCDEAIMYQFGAVCVRPCDVRYVAKKLQGSGVNVCTVVGFPWGIQSKDAKSYEAQQAIYDGANEIDMVINRLFAKGKHADDYSKLVTEISDVVLNCKNSIYAASDVIVKTILETCELTGNEIIQACLAAREAGADFVKTSTGLYKGATIKAVRLMYESVPELGVKASGGIRDLEKAYKMVEAGATRLGTSSGVKIVSEYAHLIVE